MVTTHVLVVLFLLHDVNEMMLGREAELWSTLKFRIHCLQKNLRKFIPECQKCGMHVSCPKSLEFTCFKAYNESYHHFTYSNVIFPVTLFSKCYKLKSNN